MKTEKETMDFLDSLQWQRMSKKVLQAKLQEFFETENKLEDSTDKEFKDADYSFVFTDGCESSTINFVDIEIWYLKMRNGNILITGTEILDYEY